LETMMIWQLLQVGHLQNVPLILVGAMWPGLIDWARASMLASDPPLASAEDMTIPPCVTNADEAIAILRARPNHSLDARNPEHSHSAPSRRCARRDQCL